MGEAQKKSPATYFKEEVWALIFSRRYSQDMTVYETLGALDAVKADLLDELRRSNAEELRDGD